MYLHSSVCICATAQRFVVLRVCICMATKTNRRSIRLFMMYHKTKKKGEWINIKKQNITTRMNEHKLLAFLNNSTKVGIVKEKLKNLAILSFQLVKAESAFETVWKIPFVPSKMGFFSMCFLVYKMIFLMFYSRYIMYIGRRDRLV